MYLKCFVCVFVVFVALTSVNGKKKNDSDKKRGHGLGCGPNWTKSLNLIDTCAGQPMHITIDETSVNTCLETRFQKIQAQNVETKDNEKARKKLEKKKEKLQKKLKKKCTPECEFELFGMIPNNTADGIMDADSLNTDKFLSLFPNEVREDIRTSLELCYNKTQSLPLKMFKAKKPENNLCAENRRLVKCFKRVVKRNCRLGRTKANPNMSSTTDLPTSPAGNNTNTIQVNSTAQPFVGNGTKSQDQSQTFDNNEDDADENDDDGEDTDDNSEEDSDIESTTTTSIKKVAPTSSVDMSAPLTK